MRLYTIIGILSLLVLGYVAVAEAETLRYDDKQTGEYFRLFDAPCSLSEVRERLTQMGNDLGVPAEVIETVVAGLHLGEARVDGTVYAMCWSEMLDGTYGLIYPDGDEGKLPMWLFKPEVL